MTDTSSYIIYPRYINGNAKQEDGRRIAKQSCPSNPTIEQIATHLQKLFPNAKLVQEEEKRYPRSAVEAHDIGRVKITKIDGVKKNDILKKVAESILAERQAQLQKQAEQVKQPAPQQQKKGKR